MVYQQIEYQVQASLGRNEWVILIYLLSRQRRWKVGGVPSRFLLEFDVAQSPAT